MGPIMQKILLSTLLLSLTSLPASAQISGSSDIDQKGSSRPVYGQSPQSSKMTPGGSKGQAASSANSASSQGSGGAAPNSAADGSGTEGSSGAKNRPRPSAKGDRHGSGAERPQESSGQK